MRRLPLLFLFLVPMISIWASCSKSGEGISTILGKTIYVAGDPDGLYASTDFGQTWTLKNADLVISKVFAVGGSLLLQLDGQICISNDGGATCAQTLSMRDGLQSPGVDQIFKSGTSVYFSSLFGLARSN